MALPEPDSEERAPRRGVIPPRLKARLSGLQFKLIVPYVLLTLTIAGKNYPILFLHTASGNLQLASTNLRKALFRSESTHPAVADGAFVSFYLFKGIYDLRLEYDPVSQRLGLYVTLLTLGVIAFYFGRRMGRNRHLKGEIHD